MELRFLDSFLTGHPAIDAQHRALFEAGNNVVGLIGQGLPAEAGPALDRFVELFEAHFTVEERILDDMGYPYQEKHDGQHRRLSKELLALVSSYNTGADTRGFFEGLIAVLVDDIVECDSEYISFLIEKGASHRV